MNFFWFYKMTFALSWAELTGGKKDGIDFVKFVLAMNAFCPEVSIEDKQRGKDPTQTLMIRVMG